MEDKKFSSEMFGYNKEDVEEYIKGLVAEYESKIGAEKADSSRLSNELTIVKKKLERYEIDYLERQEKVANALITAEEQSKKIIEVARIEAEAERERIEHLIEMEKEKLLDMKKEVIDLKEKLIVMMDKYGKDLNCLLD